MAFIAYYIDVRDHLEKQNFRDLMHSHLGIMVEEGTCKKNGHGLMRMEGIQILFVKTRSGGMVKAF